MTLQPHQQRVLDEHTDLHDRMQKLSAFFGTPVYNGLPYAEKRLLQRQFEAMFQYEDALRTRLSMWGHETS